MERHRHKFSNRRGIGINDVKFKAAQIYSFAAIDVEDMLLRLARQRSVSARMPEHKRDHQEWNAQLAEIDRDEPARPEKPAKRSPEHRDAMALFNSELKSWKARRRQHLRLVPKAPTFDETEPPFLNNSGFGSNDTGAKRDSQKTSKFDHRYPLDPDSTVDAFAMAREQCANALRGARLEPVRPDLASGLAWFGKNVPFTFRVQEDTDAALSGIAVDSSKLFAAGPMRSVLARISSKLPEGWLISIMLGKVLVYREGDKKPEDVQMHFVSGVEHMPDGKKATRKG